MSCFGVPAKVGQASLLLPDRIGDADDFQVVDGLTGFDPMAEQPGQFTELGGITFVGFLTRGVLWLDEHDSVAAKVFQHFDEPIVEATDFHDRPGPTAFLGTLGSQLLEEFDNFLGLGADLALENGVAASVPQVDGLLLCMLINSKVKHVWFFS